MKNQWFALMIVGLLTIAPAAVLAQETEEAEHVRPVADVVADIVAAQGVSDQRSIECSEVSDEQFEELGDAVMQAMIGSTEQHEFMDEMMGGEGSASLRAMHISMGQRYLGCDSGQFGTMGMTPLRQGFAGQVGGMMSMMSGFMNMRDGSFGPWGFMGSGWGFGLVLFWIVVIVGIVLLVKLLAGQPSTPRGNTALDILRERYAKGEISKEEFENKKKDLTA